MIPVEYNFFIQHFRTRSLVYKPGVLKFLAIWSFYNIKSSVSIVEAYSGNNQTALIHDEAYNSKFTRHY